MSRRPPYGPLFLPIVTILLAANVVPLVIAMARKWVITALLFGVGAILVLTVTVALWRRGQS